MAVDGEALPDMGFRKRCLHIADTRRKTAALMSGEGYDCLAVKIDVTEKREHYLRIGPPPNGTTYKDCVVRREVRSLTFIGRQLAVVSLFFGEVDEGL